MIGTVVVRDSHNTKKIVKTHCHPEVNGKKIQKQKKNLILSKTLTVLSNKIHLSIKQDTIYQVTETTVNSSELLTP